MTIPEPYLKHVRESYRDFATPRRDFVLDAVDHASPADVVRALSVLGVVTEDTDVNCDVCFTLVVEADPTLIVKLSMVGPYAVVLSCLDGPAARATLLEPSDAGAEAVFAILRDQGVLTPSIELLESEVPISFPNSGRQATLYAALFEPEGDVPASTARRGRRDRSA